MAFDWSTLVAPGFALGGIVAGWGLNQRSDRERRSEAREAEKERRRADRDEERERWLRDNRLSAYIDFTVAVRTFQHLASELDSVNYDAEEAKTARARLIEALGSIGDRSAVLPLIAPKAVAMIAAEVEMLCLLVIDAVVDNVPLQGNLERQRAWSSLGRWTGTITAAARADLEGHPITAVPIDLPTTPNWTKGKGWNDPALQGADLS